MTYNWFTWFGNADRNAQSIKSKLRNAKMGPFTVLTLEIIVLFLSISVVTQIRIEIPLLYYSKKKKKNEFFIPYPVHMCATPSRD